MKRSRHGFAGLLMACGAMASMVLVAGGADGEKAATAAKPLRMITFNIYSDWHVKGGGVKPREAGMERVLLKIKPDIAALQEVSGHWWASPLFEHLAAAYGVVRGDEAEALRRAGPPTPTKPGKPDRKSTRLNSSHP